LRRSRFPSVSLVLLSCDEPVNGRVHEAEDVGSGVEHGEVKLLAQAAHVVRKRHSPDDPFLDATLGVTVRVIEMGECPGLQIRSVMGESRLALNSQR
jgi:hypothetical protein